MAFDRDEDWGASVEKRAQGRVRKAVPDLRAMQRAALSASQMTGDEHWDLFLTVVNDRLEKKRELRDEALGMLKNSDDFTTELLINQKLAVRLFGREIEALEWVTELPQAILEKGERAKELLETVDETTH